LAKYSLPAVNDDDGVNLFFSRTEIRPYNVDAITRKVKPSLTVTIA